MSLKAPVGGSFKQQLPTAGIMKARCVAVIDLGTHLDKLYPRDDKGRDNWKHQIQIQWELDEQMEWEGELKPMMATKRYTLSSGKKANLRKDLEGWYGRKFDDEELKESGGFIVEKLLGRPANLTLVHSADGKYANVAAIAPLKEAAAQFYPSRFFELSNPSQDVWATLSQKTREYIASSEEVKSGQVTLPKMPNVEAKGAAAEASDSDAPY